jgi:hypothetical protein
VISYDKNWTDLEKQIQQKVQDVMKGRGIRYPKDKILNELCFRILEINVLFS